MIRSGDYYQFEGDPEVEDEDEETITSPTMMRTTPSSLSEAVLPVETQSLPRSSYVIPREKIQRRRPHADSSQLDALAAYKRPYRSALRR